MIKGLELLDKISPAVAEKLIKNQEQINQLHETLSVMRLDKQSALVRRLVKKTQDGTLGQPTDTGDAGEDSATAEEATVDDEDKITFGDTTTTYNLADKAKETVTKAIPSLWPYILAAALGGTGIGAAAIALPMALKAVNAVQSADTDTDMTLDLKFKEDDTK